MNISYNKNNAMVFAITIIVTVVFMYLAIGKNVYNKEDKTMEKILSNSSFIIGIILLVTALKRINPDPVSGVKITKTSLAGSVFVYTLIASFLGYIASAGSFEQLCKAEEDGKNAKWFDKEMTQRVASFGYIYIFIWKILKPIFDKFSVGNSSNSANATRTKFVSVVYLLGVVQLLFMQFKRPSVFNEEDDKPTGVKMVKNGGLIMGAMMLMFMIMFSLNSKSNKSPNFNTIIKNT